MASPQVEQQGQAKTFTRITELQQDVVAGQMLQTPNLDRWRAEAKASPSAGHFANLAAITIPYDMKDLSFKNWPLTKDEIKAHNSGVVDRAIEKYFDAKARRHPCAEARFLQRLMYQLEQFEEVGHVKHAMYDVDDGRCMCGWRFNAHLYV